MSITTLPSCRRQNYSGGMLLEDDDPLKASRVGFTRVIQGGGGFMTASRSRYWQDLTTKEFAGSMANARSPCFRSAP